MTRLIAAALALLIAPPALSQDAAMPDRIANGQTFGAWTVMCEAIAVGETTCALGQQLLRSADRAFLAQIIALWSPADQKRYFTARVPVGAYLPSGFAMKPDGAGDETAVQLIWQACDANLCEALTEIDDDMLAAFAAPGTQIIASYRPNIRSEPVVFTFSMAGIVEGLTALQPN
jgi:invasion protein IalB